MRYNIGELNELITTIYSAALDPGRWNEVIAQTGELADGVRTHIFGYDYDTNTNLGFILDGYSPEFVRSYEDHYCHLNAWAEGFLDGEAGKPIFSEWMCSREKLEKTEFYNDWVNPQEDIIAGGGALLFKEERRMIAFGGNIRRKDGDAKEKKWMQLVNIITPHMQQAFEINRAFAGHNLEKNALVETSSSIDSAVFLIGENRRILFANHAANVLLEYGDVVRLDRKHTICFADVHCQLWLNSKLRQRSYNAVQLPQTFELSSVGRDKQYRCRTAQLDPSGQDRSPFGALVSEQEPSILLVISLLGNSKLQIDKLKLHYNLTEKEAQVALCISKGMAPDEIVDLHSVSINTVRNQLKSAMSKMGARRQAELVRIVMLL